MHRQKNGMVGVLFFSFIVVMLLVSVNVVIVSVMGVHINSGTSIKDYANNMAFYKETLQSRRGFIYDTNKETIAQDIDTYNLYAVLSKDIPSYPGVINYVQDEEEAATLLAPILGMSEEECYAYLNVSAGQVEFGTKGRGLNQIKKEEIEALGLTGLGFIKNSGRIYPNGPFASHLIGFAQYDAALKKVTGRMGLEQTLESYLLGTDGYIEYQKDPVTGYKLPGTETHQQQPINGNDVYLTIDATIQGYLEQGLSKAMKEFEAKKSWGVIMEVKTGRVLGYASYPTFDPNILDIDSYVDSNVGYAYEPGSTLKPFLVASAIDTQNYPGSKLVQTGLFHVGTKNGKIVRLPSRSSPGYIATIQDFNSGKGWGEIPYDIGLIRSSNTAMVSLLFNEVGTKIYREYLDKFHFFQLTGFEASGEVKGHINYTYAAELANASFGQGLSINSMQLMQAYTALFNDGIMVKPYVISEIKNPQTNEVVFKQDTQVVGNPISKSTADQVLALMTEVVENTSYGSARFYKIGEVTMTGKTGTAEIAGKDGYLTGAGNNLYSFMVAAPADDPEIMFYYAIQQANTKAMHEKTDIFKQIFRSTILHLDITDQNSKAQEAADEEYKLIAIEEKTVTSAVHMEVQAAQEALEAEGFQVQVLGEGERVLAQYPNAADSAYTTQQVFLYTGADNITMPNMVGWSRKDVIAFWSLCGIKVESSGDGFVTEQNIPTGEDITGEDVIQVIFTSAKATTAPPTLVESPPVSTKPSGT